ncbi:transglutaminase TgpA family protein [Arenimonas oryziterrae]|uniref:Transglutaminase-like domain-containing protein n=1 Tax=Arenimonas oryziterrae DSM 21050 = YC6267 TaxID=1121015 RepID=A0A091AQ14_9GAMM|nr:DUF3488 and transglutaminase-like domain-containing protein [Arenimonas oryziterrae]KFN41247.1 hypothetical protein N789_04990 [Arenimonas oryziterrae DSM 21050 = YC6267]
MIESLPRPLRGACLTAAAACALPLLIQMPVWLIPVLIAVGALGAWSQKKWPTPLRVLVMIMIGGLVFAAFGFRIGRDTASAGLLAMLVLKPAETFSTRDARSLLGFSLFAPFTAFLQDQGPLTLALCVPAMLLMLMAWSLLVQDGAGLQLATLPRQLKQSGFALLIAAPMALAGFWLFPRLASPLWGLPQLSAKRMGLGDRMTPNEWLDVLVDDSPALRARFLGPAPPREQMYWRGPVLSRFDGEAWTRTSATAFAAPPVLRPDAATVRYEVMLEPTESRDLVLLDVPLGAPAESHLTRELSAVRDEPVNNLIRYVGESSPSARFEGSLNAIEMSSLLSLPTGRDPRLRARAVQWHAQTPDPLQLTERFLQWVRADFQYTLSAPPVGYHASDDFMFETRQGFCQHFSSAYVVFMRAAGIPARVVTGYAGGHYNRVGDYWLVYRKDAHAWAEIWIEGRGWVRVDPTAAVAPENILDTIDDLQAQQGLGPDMLQPMFDMSDMLRRGWNELVLGFDSVRQRNLLRPLGIRDAEAWQLVLAFAVGAALALGLTLWLLLREHKDRSDPLVQAWRAFAKRLGRAGIRKAPNEAPLSYGERVAALLPANADTVRRLSGRYCEWRYAGTELSATERQALIRELRRFRVGRTPPEQR